MVYCHSFGEVHTILDGEVICFLRLDRYWCSDLWDRFFDELLNFDYRSADTGRTEEVLGQLEALLCSYMNDLRRPYELQECLRKQENMFFDR